MNLVQTVLNQAQHIKISVKTSVKLRISADIQKIKYQKIKYRPIISVDRYIVRSLFQIKSFQVVNQYDFGTTANCLPSSPNAQQ